MKKCLEEKAVKESKGRDRNFLIKNSLFKSLVNENDPFLFDLFQIKKSISFQRLTEKEKNPGQSQMIFYLELALYSEALAKVLGLNPKLSQAIALASGLGRGPQEIVLRNYLKQNYDQLFNFDLSNLTVVKKVEKLKLSFEVLEGLVYKTRREEYKLVFFLDRFLELVSSFEHQGPRKPKELFYLGESKEEQIQSLIQGLLKESSRAGRIKFEKSNMAQAFIFLERWLEKNLYIPEHDKIRQNFHQASHFLECIVGLSSGKIPLVLSLLSDKELKLFSSFNHKSSLEDIKEIEKLEIFNLIPQCPGRLMTRKEFFW